MSEASPSWAEEHPSTVQRLSEARAGLEARSQTAPRDSADVQLNSSMIEELRALGYVQ